MMIIKEMTITNSSGDSIKFGRHFKLIDDFELSGLDADVNYSETTDDGSNYQNTVLANKEFDVPFFIQKDMRDSWWIEEKRSRAYTVFNPKLNPFVVSIKTKGGREYYINANLESSPTFGRKFEDNNILWLKGLLQFSANDPYFYEKNSTVVNISSWIGEFKFPLNLDEGGIRMGSKSKSLFVNVKNSGHTSTGMIVRFSATSKVTNPSIINVNTYENLKLEMELEGGDEVIVSTYKGKKTATLIRNNIEHDIFSYVSLDSKFMQLNPGDNIFRPGVDGGSLDDLNVSIKFTNRYMGV